MAMGRRRRAEVIDESKVGIFHITSRCVRQAFLCGEHAGDEKDYSHRRGWIEERVRFLASVFLVDILGFGVMSNHCHYILRNRPDLISRLTDRELAQRIWRLRNETDTLDPSQRRRRRRRAERRLAAIEAISRDTELIATHRQRLSSISWFMSSLNYRIACRANHEDGVTGRFWEGRFRCHPVLSQEHLLAAMVYIDLNPIRAGLADRPEDSIYTSVYRRAHAARARREAFQTSRERARQVNDEAQAQRTFDEFLSPIDERDETLQTAFADIVHTDRLHADGAIRSDALPAARASDADITDPWPYARASDKGCLPMTAAEYLSMVDLMGRRAREDHRRSIPADLPPICQRLGLGDAQAWLDTYDQFSATMTRAFGLPTNPPASLGSWSMPSATEPTLLINSFI
jgi:REP element-mobilizing transposase RayT